MSLRPLNGALAGEKPSQWWAEDARDSSRTSRDREKNDSMDVKDKESVSYRLLLSSFEVVLPRGLSYFFYYCC